MSRFVSTDHQIAFLPAIEIAMLTPFRLIFLLVLAAATPYVASETEFGRSMFSRVTNLVRHEPRASEGSGAPFFSSQASSSGALVSRNATSAGAALPSTDESSGFASFFGFGSDTSSSSDRSVTPAVRRRSNAVDASYANHSHYEVEKLRLENEADYTYDEQLVRKLGGVPDNAPLPSLVGTRVDDLRKVIRFDATPEKVIAHFSRVSTVLADLSLQGLRVPVVTGTEATDLAGTMTYYFDKSGLTQRISLHGFTGDPQELISTLTQHYELQHEPAIEAGVYMKRWNGQPVNFLRITHAPVVRTEAIHQKYTVFLELNHPNLAYGISNEARRIVAADRATGRW